MLGAVTCGQACRLEPIVTILKLRTFSRLPSSFLLTWTRHGVPPPVPPAAGATAVQKVESGSSNGTIKVDNTDVSVTGLKSAAYTESSAYATAAQGTKIDNITSATILELGAATGVDGNYVLTMKKEGSTITYKWEAIDRAY